MGVRPLFGEAPVPHPPSRHHGGRSEVQGALSNPKQMWPVSFCEPWGKQMQGKWAAFPDPCVLVPSPPHPLHKPVMVSATLATDGHAGVNVGTWTWTGPSGLQSCWALATSECVHPERECRWCRVPGHLSSGRPAPQPHPLAPLYASVSGAFIRISEGFSPLKC